MLVVVRRRWRMMVMMAVRSHQAVRVGERGCRRRMVTVLVVIGEHAGRREVRRVEQLGGRVRLRLDGMVDGQQL